jgi:Fe-S-cluster-containing hydrogenase component 2
MERHSSEITMKNASCTGTRLCVPVLSFGAVAIVDDHSMLPRLTLAFRTGSAYEDVQRSARWR